MRADILIKGLLYWARQFLTQPQVTECDSKLYLSSGHSGKGIRERGWKLSMKWTLNFINDPGVKELFWAHEYIYFNFNY